MRYLIHLRMTLSPILKVLQIVQYKPESLPFQKGHMFSQWQDTRDHVYCSCIHSWHSPQVTPHHTTQQFVQFMIVQHSNRAFHCKLASTARIYPEETAQMDRVKVVIFAVICLLSHKAGDCNMLNISVVGVSGPPGPKGSCGPPAPIGGHGPYSDLSPEKFNQKVTDLVMNITSAFTKCDTFNTAWRRVAYIDMKDPVAECPSALKVFNDTMSQVACGKNASENCTSLTFPTGWSYTHVCGRVRGYHFGETEGFTNGSIANHYADGVLITSGNRNTYLWTYAIRTREGSDDDNPCSAPNAEMKIHHSCDIRLTNETDWDNPLWNETKHTTHGNPSRQDNHLWFHRQVKHTSDSIEVRWCAPTGSAVFTDLLEIWVM